MRIQLCLRSICHIGKFIVEANFGRLLRLLSALYFYCFVDFLMARLLATQTSLWIPTYGHSASFSQVTGLLACILKPCLVMCECVHGACETMSVISWNWIMGSVNGHVDSVNKNQVLCKSCQCSQPLNDLSSP